MSIVKMKKLLLLVSISLISLTSCSSDDENPSILGKWYSYKRTEIINGQQEETLHTHECPAKNDFVEFLQNNITTILHNQQCEVFYTDTENYSISGSNLTIESGSGTMQFLFEIKTLNNNTLVLESTIEELDVNGNITIIKILDEFKRN